MRYGLRAAVLFVVVTLFASGCYWADEQVGEAYTTLFPPGEWSEDNFTPYERAHAVHVWKPTRGFNGAKMQVYKRTIGGKGSGKHAEVECRSVPPSEDPFVLDDLWVILNRDKVNSDNRNDRWIEAGVLYKCNLDSSNSGTRNKYAIAALYPHRHASPSERIDKYTSLSSSDTALAKFQIYMRADCHKWRVTYNGNVVLDVVASFCDYAEEYHSGTETNASWTTTWLKKKHNHLAKVEWWSGTQWVNGGRPLVHIDQNANMGGHGMDTNDEIHTCARVTATCH